MKFKDIAYSVGVITVVVVIGTEVYQVVGLPPNEPYIINVSSGKESRSLIFQDHVQNEIEKELRSYDVMMASSGSMGNTISKDLRFSN